ncbi:MAG: flap endonuclease-1 [Nanoarchaeota archaeon]|nr:flap endonuclease-1 [Nanoarchaeota archaeon]
MGLSIREIIPKKEISFPQLCGKTIVIDAFNVIYQFLSTIRQYDGTPLQDKNGRITSHLSGLFYRNLSLLSEGIKIIYVFDGEPPELKKTLREKRESVKKSANEKYEEAKENENIEDMNRYSKQNVHITREIIEESKQFLLAMGIPVIQAPGEGEAQASFLAKRKDIYAVGSQDYDCLLFGAPMLIQNLTLSRKRKTISGIVEIHPELITLEYVLNHLQINHEQLICLGILTGTDYNPAGIKGVGQKRALEIVKKFKSPVEIFAQFPEADFDWQEIFQLFKKPEIHERVEIEFPKINENKIKEILMSHDFLEERIDKQLVKLQEIKEKAKQKKLF